MANTQHHLTVSLTLSTLAFTACSLWALYQAHTGAAPHSWSLCATYMLSGLWWGTSLWAWMDWQDNNVRKDHK